MVCTHRGLEAVPRTDGKGAKKKPGALFGSWCRSRSTDGALLNRRQGGSGGVLEGETGKRPGLLFGKEANHVHE